MFMYPTGLPYFSMAVIDESDETGMKILRAARRAASERFSPDSTGSARKRLRELFDTLDTGSLNVLSAMWMISDRWNGATGAGGIWAAASDIANEVAREVLHTRPMFEVVG